MTSNLKEILKIYHIYTAIKLNHCIVINVTFQELKIGFVFVNSCKIHSCFWKETQTTIK